MTLAERTLLFMEPGREYETRELYAMAEREADDLLRDIPADCLPGGRAAKLEDITGLLPEEDREWVRTVKGGTWRVMIDAMKETRQAGLTAIRFIDTKPQTWGSGGRRIRRDGYRVWLHRLREK